MRSLDTAVTNGLLKKQNTEGQDMNPTHDSSDTGVEGLVPDQQHGAEQGVFEASVSIDISSAEVKR